MSRIEMMFASGSRQMAKDPARLIADIGDELSLAIEILSESVDPNTPNLRAQVKNLLAEGTSLQRIPELLRK